MKGIDLRMALHKCNQDYKTCNNEKCCAYQKDTKECVLKSVKKHEVWAKNEHKRFDKYMKENFYD